MEIVSTLPPLSGNSYDLTDWVEFKVLVSEFKAHSIVELFYVNDELQDTENINISEQDAENEAVLEKMYEELKFRQNSLGDTYPFELSGKRGTSLSLKTELNIGGYTYLYCLFISHYNRDHVLYIDPPLSNSDRDILQICSTWAAAGDIGNAISFGFPRPDNSNFLDALKSLYPRIKDGEVVDELKPGTPQNEKDGGIDVIAWQNTPDGLPGQLYLLGQVASGANWTEKPVQQKIKDLHTFFFNVVPGSTPIPSMFIPFCLAEGNKGDRKQHFNVKTHQYGKIYYRYRLPYYAYKGYQFADADGHYVDRINEESKLISYVDSFLAELAS